MWQLMMMVSTHMDQDWEELTPYSRQRCRPTVSRATPCHHHPDLEAGASTETDREKARILLFSYSVVKLSETSGMDWRLILYSPSSRSLKVAP
jgi:hypothetical protein